MAVNRLMLDVAGQEYILENGGRDIYMYENANAGWDVSTCWEISTTSNTKPNHISSQRP